MLQASHRRRQIYFGNGWHDPVDGRTTTLCNPGTGQFLAEVAAPTVADVEKVVDAAYQAFPGWRDTPPQIRAGALRAVAAVIREHAEELAELDAADAGNPIAHTRRDVATAVSQLEFFAGLITEIKGTSIPVGPNAVNFSVRQPMGVVARLLAYNHPFMFCAGKMAAPLAAGNSLIVKPSDQAPLSALRLAEIVGDLLPPGVFNVLPGDRDVGAALAAHPRVAKVTLIGSIPAGRAVMRTASDTVKPVLLELGGKNAFIAYGDANPTKVAAAMVRGMNLTWCGQSCGSTSRAFLHEDIHDAVLDLALSEVRKFRPGRPEDPQTTMGAMISAAQRDRVLAHIANARADGATLVCGGGVPDSAELSGGFYVEPTIFKCVDNRMRLAREEVFGPVLAVTKWRDEAQMIREVNGLEYGLTCAIWTEHLTTAHRTAMSVEAGYVWINGVSNHIPGAPFGGVKQSGLGREECLEELLSFTHEKNIYVNLD